MIGDVLTVAGCPPGVPELAAYLDHLADLGYELSETDDLVREAGHAEATRRAELAARWASPEHRRTGRSEPDQPARRHRRAGHGDTARPA